MFKKKFVLNILLNGGYLVVISPRVPRCCSEVLYVFLFDNNGYFVDKISTKLFDKLFLRFIELKHWLRVDEVGSVFSYYYMNDWR